MNSYTPQSTMYAGAGAQQRLLAVCLLASVAAHVLVFVLVPGWTQTRIALPPTLELVIVPGEPAIAPPPQQAAPVPAPPVEPAAQRATPVAQPPRPTRMPEAVPAARPELPVPSAAVPAATERPVTVPPSAPVPRPAPPSAARVEPAQSPPAYNATYLRNPPPRYPPAARRNGSEGTVMLRVLVSAQGLPVRVELEQTSGSSPLDSAALEAVRGWRFVPARRGEQAIEDWVRVPIVFRLES